jgi:hypothetical protein
MEMEKSYYVVRYKSEYLEMIRVEQPADGESSDEIAVEDRERDPIVVAITQGGFGQDVVDDERQVKERFLDQMFTTSGIDLPRTPDVFDRYFELEPVEEFLDLDEIEA